MRNITYTNYRQIPFWVVLIPDDLGSGPLLSSAIIDHERAFAGAAGRPPIPRAPPGDHDGICPAPSSAGGGSHGLGLAGCVPACGHYIIVDNI